MQQKSVKTFRCILCVEGRSIAHEKTFRCICVEGRRIVHAKSFRCLHVEGRSTVHVQTLCCALYRGADLALAHRSQSASFHRVTCCLQMTFVLYLR